MDITHGWMDREIDIGNLCSAISCTHLNCTRCTNIARIISS